MIASEHPEDTQLEHIYHDIRLRVFSAVEARGEWPCRQGCDGCCRRLANPPEVTEAEWLRMRQGLAELSPSVQMEVGARVEALAGPATRPDGLVTCPFLEEAQGECLIYDERPAACRMYGFYVSRQGNQWCTIIQALDEAGELDGIILGNYDAAQRELTRRVGEGKSIVEWHSAQRIVATE